MFAFLPLKIFEVNLRWLEAGEMPFFHQPLVNAFMRHLLGSPENYEQCWAIHTPESGQLHYAAGDWYRFYCIALPCSSVGAPDSANSAFGYSSQAQLFDQLSKLPHGDFVHNMRGQFGGQFELVSIRDALTQQSLASPEQAMPIDMDSIEHEAQQWYALQPKSLVLEFLSPIRLSTPKTRGKGEQGVVRHPQQFDPNMLFMRLVQAIQQLHNVQHDKERVNEWGKPERLPFCEQPDWQLENPSERTQLFWADCGYQSLKGEYKTLGGLCGSLCLTINAPLTLQQWQYLVAGQYLGIGLSRGLGFGRYRLLAYGNQEQAQSTLLTFTRANSLYQQMIAGERIHSVWQDELRKLPEKQRYQWQGEEAVTDLIHAIHQPDYAYRYQPQPLHPVLIDEDTPKPRMLLLPGFRDKVLQKSASLWLGESLDNLYSYASYGYRKGRSRLTVKDKIQQAWREGYRWVVDADIRSFFQNVNTTQLLHKLKALYGNDPIWELIRAWLNTPINRDKLPHGYEGFQLKGLPLGSAISPVLANLMLDDCLFLIGADMEDHQLQLIRFVDDFIILCKTKEQAEQLVLSELRRDTGYSVSLYSLKEKNLFFN
ncbi:group II intron reverse transcriptase domain-containing protein [Paraneptunicella aestuarii]|uniref:reverse transcriptase/maturase family protein n=1 Tax=Paraneptunicella aestuarii TaxID=2831148 RepID=UPI001E54C0B4|nr:reverse transcriptase/maturase family protein [Paraneptunicella aestuarii]UAA37397.1 group II intron reverse transcriptase domain-containing protein [Paraneptunicella aestuarii]